MQGMNVVTRKDEFFWKTVRSTFDRVSDYKVWERNVALNEGSAAISCAVIP